jgi:hypothetical protein
MTRKEQIIEVLQKHIFADGDIWVIYDLKKMYDDLLPILALPLEVPIGLDCEIWRQKDRQYLIDKEVFTQGELDQRLLGRWEGLTWMKDEIINLNDTK